jgi:hypothetical protein
MDLRLTIISKTTTYWQAGRHTHLVMVAKKTHCTGKVVNKT